MTVTFDATVAAVLADCSPGVMGTIHHAGDGASEHGGAHVQLSPDDVTPLRPTCAGDHATIFPNGWHSGSLNIEAAGSGELYIAAITGGGAEQSWHLTTPTEPECIGEEVFTVADALRAAAEFIGWKRGMTP